MHKRRISLEKAQEISGIGYWELDFEKDELIWSNQVYKIFGVDPANFSPTQTRFLEFVHPDDREKIHDAFAIALETGRPYKFQHRIVLNNGSLRYVIEKSESIVDDEGNALKSFGSIQDITETVEARMKLESSQQKFKAISNQTTEGITLADTEGNYVFVNPAFCRMSGYSEAELLAMTVFDLNNNYKDRTNFKAEKEKLAGVPIKVKLQKKNGTDFYAEIIGDIITIEGELLILGTIRDVTERIKSEEMIRNLNKDLELKVKKRTEQLDNTIRRLSREVEQRKKVEEQLKDSLAAKEILFREVTHRVKNNMQIISSLIKLQKAHLDKTACDFLEQIEHRIHAMALIHETLYKTNKFEDIRFNYYLNSLINYIGESYSFKNCDIQLDAEEHQLPLDVGTSLGMIIIELVMNSLKHAFTKGNEKGEIKVCFKEKEEVNNFQLIVSDNGAGFPRDTDFRNTTTLGLDLVVSLVDSINGEIELFRNDGTRFEITFAKM